MKKTLKQIGGHARQGDVLLRRVKANKRKEKQLGKVPLALGEVTGHAHAFRSAEVYGELEPTVAVLDQPDTLTHQEHAPITFPKGHYERLTQVEDTSQEVRRVQD